MYDNPKMSHMVIITNMQNPKRGVLDVIQDQIVGLYHSTYMYWTYIYIYENPPPSRYLMYSGTYVYVTVADPGGGGARGARPPPLPKKNK